jgi:hypothetical protein
MLERLQAEFNLTSKLPEDFDGIPVVPPFTARFFPWGYERRVDDISSLWALAKSTPYGQKTRRARCPTHEPHFKRRLMMNQAR